jgi:hypothetical protein
MVLSFNGMDRRGEAQLARVSPAAQAGTQVASPAALPSSRHVFRARILMLLRPLNRTNRRETRRIGARLERAPWSSSEELQVELSRSRRFGHSFALVRIPCRYAVEGGWNLRRELAGALSALVRRVDRVWSEGGTVYVLLPECNRTMVEAMLARINEPLSKLLSEEDRAAVSAAVFPDDGVTSGALYSALKRRSITPAMRHGHNGRVRAPESPAA